MAIRKVIPRSLDSAAASANLSFDANTLYVDSTNNVVGINTATPNSFATGLAVYNAANPSLAIVSGNANAYLRLYSTSDTDMYLSNLGGKMTFTTAATARMTIDSSGNVGIGTASPGNKLEISGGSIRTINNTSGRITFNNGTTEAYVGFNGSGATILEAGALPLNISTTGANYLTLNTNGTERMRIDSAGKVGIGNSSPAAQNLHVGSGAGGSTAINGYTRLAVEASDYAVVTVKCPAANFSQIIFADSATTNLGGINYFGSTNATPNVMTFLTGGGTERMRLDSSGNVGIGTSSPSARLDVVSASTSVAKFTGPANGFVTFTGTGFVEGKIQCGGEFNIGSTNSYPVAFLTNSTERMRIDSSGNVGIGTSSPAAAYKLSVNGTGNFYQSVAGLGRIFLGDPADASGYIGMYRSALGPSNSTTAGNSLNFASLDGYTFNTSVSSAFGSQTERMRIDSGGNLLLGRTTGDGYRFSLVGTTQLLAGMQLTYSAVAASSISVTSGGAMAFGLDASSGGTERMRIDSSGNLLVGTITTSNTNGVMLGKGGAAGGGIIQLFKTSSGSTNGFLNYYGTTYVGGINFDNTSTSFPTSSDKRLKKDIFESASATQKIDDIRIVSHGWKHDEAVVDFGIIAQDLYEIMPRAVSKGDDEDEIQTVWSVDYSKLVPLLIKAHQEQQALITTLTARITALESKEIS